MKFLTALTIIFATSVASAHTVVDNNFDWGRFLTLLVVGDSTTDPYPELFIEDFPFFILDEQNTVFDVCKKDGGFKSRTNGNTVKSTFKKCTSYIIDSNTLRSKCDPNSIEENPVPTSYSITIFSYLGDFESFKNAPNYSKFIQEKRPYMSQFPEIFSRKVMPNYNNDYFVSMVKARYDIPNCN